MKKKSNVKNIDGKIVWVGIKPPKGLVSKKDVEESSRQFLEDKKNHSIGIVTSKMRKRGWSLKEIRI